MFHFTLKDHVEDSDPVLFEEIESQYSMSHEPELICDTSDNEGYWDSIYRLSLRGKLDEAWRILQLHSSVASILRISERHDAADCRCIAELQLIFNSHPLAAVQQSSSFPHDFDDFRYHEECSRWQKKVYSFWSSAYSVVATMPQLDPLLRVMRGESRALHEIASKSKFPYGWRELALANLLYPSKMQVLTTSWVVSIVEQSILDEQLYKRMRLGSRSESRGLGLGMTVEDDLMDEEVDEVEEERYEKYNMLCRIQYCFILIMFVVLFSLFSYAYLFLLSMLENNLESRC